MSTLKYPEWQIYYEAALVEFDPPKLATLVASTETAIFFRLLALSRSSDGYEERHAIAAAAEQLLMIKQDRLAYPAVQPAD